MRSLLLALVSAFSVSAVAGGFSSTLPPITCKGQTYIQCLAGNVINASPIPLAAISPLPANTVPANLTGSAAAPTATAVTGSGTSLVTNSGPTIAGTTLVATLGGSAADGAPVIVGTNTNDSAATGNVGEAVRSTLGQGSAVSVTASNTFFTVVSISLTAGDWDLSAMGCSTVVASTGTPVFQVLQAAINSTGGNTSGTTGDNRIQSSAGPNSIADSCVTIPDYRVSLSGSATYYMTMSIVYSAGSSGDYGVYGRLSARRVR